MPANLGNQPNGKQKHPPVLRPCKPLHHFLLATTNANQGRFAICPIAGSRAAKCDPVVNPRRCAEGAIDAGTTATAMRCELGNCRLGGSSESTNRSGVLSVRSLARISGSKRAKQVPAIRRSSWALTESISIGNRRRSRSRCDCQRSNQNRWLTVSPTETETSRVLARRRFCDPPNQVSNCGFGAGE